MLALEHHPNRLSRTPGEYLLALAMPRPLKESSLRQSPRRSIVMRLPGRET